MEASKLKLLEQELTALGIPASYYSLGRVQDDRMCLVSIDGKWTVFYSERGRMEQGSTFVDFESAKAELVARLQ